MKRLKKSYWEDTHPVLKKLGDSFLIIGTTISATAMYEDIKWLAITSLVCMILGKLITNLFSK